MEIENVYFIYLSLAELCQQPATASSYPVCVSHFSVQDGRWLAEWCHRCHVLCYVMLHYDVMLH